MAEQAVFGFQPLQQQGVGKAGNELEYDIAAAGESPVQLFQPMVICFVGRVYAGQKYAKRPRGTSFR